MFDVYILRGMAQGEAVQFFLYHLGGTATVALRGKPKKSGYLTFDPCG